MKKMSIFAMLLAAVLVTSYSVSGTYAKYTSTFEGNSDSARVAKWSFKVNDTAATNSFEFNLFDTVKDTVDGNDEADVMVGTDETIIAPGTKGSFDIKLENLSEVNAKYAIDYTVTNDYNIPVEFSIDGTNWTTDLADVAASDTTVLNMDGGQDTITIQWRWTFEAAERIDALSATTDATDTALGENGEYTITVKADVTVTQID